MEFFKSILNGFDSILKGFQTFLFFQDPKKPIYDRIADIDTRIKTYKPIKTDYSFEHFNKQYKEKILEYKEKIEPGVWEIKTEHYVVRKNNKNIRRSRYQ